MGNVTTIHVLILIFAMVIPSLVGIAMVIRDEYQIRKTRKMENAKRAEQERMVVVQRALEAKKRRIRSEQQEWDSVFSMISGHPQSRQPLTVRHKRGRVYL